MMSLTQALFIVDVPSSFSPYVEFKEKTQQWKLLSEYFMFFCDLYSSKGLLFSPGLYFSDRSVNSLVGPFPLAERGCVLDLMLV